jgi:hypothetical protein
MVKSIHIILDDEDYEKIIKKKGNKTWKEFLLEKVEE